MTPAESWTELANQSLGHLGSAEEISNIESEIEISAEANAARLYLPVAIRTMLRAHEWNFAKVGPTALSLVEEEPSTQWGFSYRYPSDCLAFRRINNGTAHDTVETKIPWGQTTDGEGRLILTSQEDAEGEWTRDIWKTNEDESVVLRDVEFFPPDFLVAVGYLNASMMAVRLTDGDPFNLGVKAFAFYSEVWLPIAKASDGNEQLSDAPETSKYERAR